MAVKLVALWSTPTDSVGFEKDYASTHVALVAAIPGLQESTFSKALDGPYFRMAELTFEDGDALGTAIGSPQGLEVLADSTRLQEAYGTKLDVLVVEQDLTR